jgi:hypothetical protein
VYNELENVYKFYPGKLIDKSFEAETSMAMSLNMMVLPQACLIIRNVWEAGLSWKTIITVYAIGIICRYMLKYLLLC